MAGKKITRKNKIVITGLAAGAAILAAALIFAFRSGSHASTETSAYVSTVSSIINPGNDTGVINRYAGVVEAQKTLSVALNSEKTVAETRVSEGDRVSVGDVLFVYSTETDQENLEKGKLELEKIENTIANKQSQINQLTSEKSKAGSDEQLDYTMQIQSAQMEMKESEYSKKSKEVEIQKLEESIANAEVKATMAGTVKSVGSSDSGDSSAYITIIADGTFRVKGKINEQNLSQISSGQKVIVHSRVDENKTWTGTLNELDTNTTASSSQTSDTDTTASSSSYYFYVNLDDSTGLMLGQHVYIEPDHGQNKEREGIWLDEGYLGYEEDGTAYVWAAKNGKLEKRKVELGEYDEELSQYQIASGLAEDDLIAYNDGSLEEGQSVYDTVSDTEDPAEDSTEDNAGQEDVTRSEESGGDEA